MKLFLKTINKENPIIKLINVKILSDFAVGVRVFKDGVIVEDDVQLFAPDGTELTPMEGSFGDYTAFQLQAGDGVHQDIYKVVVGTDSYPITIDVEEGTTAEIGGAGGVPDTVMLKNDTLSTEDGEFEFEYTTDNDCIELYVTGKYDGDEEYQTFIYDGGVDLTHTVEGNEREYAEYYVNGLTLHKTQSGDYNQAIYFADETKLVGPDSSDNRKEFEAKTTPMTVTVSHQNKNEGAVDAKSELAPSYVRTLSVDNNETVHKAELKHDGVYLDEAGYKSLEVVGTTEDDEQITFKVLGYEVQA